MARNSPNPTAVPGFDAATADSFVRLGFALGSLSRELRSHPLRAAWDFRAMVQGARSAAAIAGLAVDHGRLLAAAADLPVSIHRDDAGLAFALRHIRIQADWFLAARTARGDIPRLLLDLRPDEPDHAGPWARRWFAWADEDVAACIDGLAAAPSGLPGLLVGAWSWGMAGKDPMALTIALPVVAYARALSPTPLPGLAGRALVPSRRRDAWFSTLADEMAGNVASLQRLIQGLERARLGIADTIDAVSASSRLPAVADLALSRPVITAPLVVRHLTRLAHRGGALGRTSPLTFSARQTAISAVGAGHMLRDLARSGWLVEMTGNRTCKAYVLRDLADLGIDVVPARKRRRRAPAEMEPTEFPPLPAPADRVPPIEADFSDILSDLRIVEGRVVALLEERGLRARTGRPT